MARDWPTREDPPPGTQPLARLAVRSPAPPGARQGPPWRGAFPWAQVHTHLEGNRGLTRGSGWVLGSRWGHPRAVGPPPLPAPPPRGPAAPPRGPQVPRRCPPPAALPPHSAALRSGRARAMLRTAGKELALVRGPGAPGPPFLATPDAGSRSRCPGPYLPATRTLGLARDSLPRASRPPAQ